MNLFFCPSWSYLSSSTLGNSMQGQLFVGNIYTSGKHWCFLLSLFTHPSTWNPRHMCSFLLRCSMSERKHFKSLATLEEELWMKIMLCGGHEMFSLIKTPNTVWLKRQSKLMINANAVISVFLALSGLDLISPQHDTLFNFSNPITSCQLWVAAPLFLVFPVA